MHTVLSAIGFFLTLALFFVFIFLWTLKFFT